MARWRKQPRNEGIHCYTDPMGCDLAVKGEVFIRVRPVARGWYWYGMGANTLGDYSPPKTFETIDLAKDHAFEHYYNHPVVVAQRKRDDARHAMQARKK